MSLYSPLKNCVCKKYLPFIAKNIKGRDILEHFESFRIPLTAKDLESSG